MIQTFFFVLAIIVICGLVAVYQWESKHKDTDREDTSSNIYIGMEVPPVFGNKDNKKNKGK